MMQTDQGRLLITIVVKLGAFSGFENQNLPGQGKRLRPKYDRDEVYCIVSLIGANSTVEFLF